MNDETRPDIEVLHYYDGPLAYAERTPDGRILYHHYFDDEGDGRVFAVVAVTGAELADLRAGRCDIRGLFDDRPAWRRVEDDPMEPWTPDDSVLPDRGVTLYRPGA